MPRLSVACAIAAVVATVSCAGDDGCRRDATVPPAAVTASRRHLRFAVIGDYGETNASARAVADLVRRWKPQLVITTGDNNYPDGAAATIDENVGRYYHRFIAPYRGHFGIGATRNRFFPSLGNHDWHAANAAPYLDYFTLPGNERYYDFTAGPIHFLALDSDPKEPDGVGGGSRQARWLEWRLRSSTACWRFVFFHHAPYSSGDKRPGDWMRWPFAQWGADVVVAGHEHTYERLVVDGVTYFVVGLGGAGIYTFKKVPASGSQVRFNADHGAMLVEADRERVTFTFAAPNGTPIDTYRLERARGLPPCSHLAAVDAGGGAVVDEGREAGLVPGGPDAGVQIRGGTGREHDAAGAGADGILDAQDEPREVMRKARTRSSSTASAYW